MSTQPTGRPGPGREPIDRFERLVANALASRQELLKSITDPRRNIEEECGHPGIVSDVGTYQDLYDRDAIACRVVQVLPRESWQVQPSVYEVEDGQTKTEFEKAWYELGRGLGSETSYYRDERGNPIWEYLIRADELSGIGHYGVLWLGIDDDLPPDVPANGEDVGDTPMFAPNLPHQPYTPPASYGPVPGDRKLLYMRPLPESLAQVTQFEGNLSSPRFGQPVMYSVSLADRRTGGQGVGLAGPTINVHWSRVIHLADNLKSGEVFGVPRMHPVLNRILDLKKLYGGSAEMYWRGALPGWALETHPQLGGDVEVDRSTLRDMMEDYMNGLQRYLALMGMSVKSLAPQVVDPTPQIRVQIEAICIRLGVPIRVFMGSERGELASSQDDAAWNDRLRDRQINYVTPRVIVPLVNRLINMRALPRPSGYSVHWPDLTSQSDTERATVAVQLTQAMVQYVQSALRDMVSPADYLNFIIRMTPAEAASVLKNAEKARAADASLRPHERLNPPRPPAPAPSHEGGRNGNGFGNPENMPPPADPRPSPPLGGRPPKR